MIRHPCNYDSGPKKRGLSTGYVRSLELLWALTFTVVPNSMSIVNELIPEIQFAFGSHGRLVAVSKLVDDPEILRQVWEDSGVQRKLDQLLADAHDNTNTDATPTNLGKGHLPQFSVRQFETIQNELVRPVSDPTPWPGDINKAETPSLPQRSTVPALSAKDVGSTTFLQNARYLLDLYFAYTHCWLPIVQKHKMFEILYSHSQIAVADAGSLAVFSAILAYSSLQKPPDSFSLEGVPDGQAALFSPEQLYVKARQQIPSHEAQGTDYAQALLILGLYKLDQGEFATSWHLIGQAVRIALDSETLPLNNSHSSNAIFSGKDDKQIQLLLSCFVLDTVVSCHLGKPPHLRTADIRLLPMPAETGPDEWEPQPTWLGETESQRQISPTRYYQPLRAMSIFNRYVGLIRILNDAMSEPPTGVSEELCAKHLCRLRCWYDQLPQHCAFPSNSSQNCLESVQGISPQLINLHLAFKSTETFLRAQRSSMPWYGLSLSRPGTKAHFIPSIIYLVSTFEAQFGASTMPAIFTSYEAISDGKFTRLSTISPNSSGTRSDASGNYQSLVPNLDFFAQYLPTPTGYSECSEAAGSVTVSYAGVMSSGKARGGKPNRTTDRDLAYRIIDVDSTTDLEHTDNDQRCPSMVDTMHEDEKEPWKELFDIVEVGEARVPNFSYHGDLDLLGGIEW